MPQLFLNFCEEIECDFLTENLIKCEIFRGTILYQLVSARKQSLLVQVEQQEGFDHNKHSTKTTLSYVRLS